jgi:integrase
MKVQLDKRFVDKVQQPGIYRCDKITGFRLKVTATGAKVFQVDGKVKGHPKPVTVTIGGYGKPWTLQQAQREAEVVRVLMRQGVNPNERKRQEIKEAEEQKAEQHRTDKAHSITLRAAFEDYLDQRDLKAKTVVAYRCIVERYGADWLDTPLTRITRDMVSDKCREVAKASPANAHNLARNLHSVFNFAKEHYQHEGRPIIDSNPAGSVKKSMKSLPPRKDVLNDLQLEEWFRVVGELQNDTVRDFFHVLLMTGCRKDEIASLKWDNVDLLGRTLTALNTKNGLDHTLPLTDFLYALFLRRWSSPGRDATWVFPSIREGCGHIGNLAKYYRAIEKNAGISTFTAHTARRTFITAAARLLPELVSKKLANHKEAKNVTQGYAIIGTDALREPMEVVYGHYAKHGKLAAAGKPSKVVPMKKSKSATI